MKQATSGKDIANLICGDAHITSVVLYGMGRQAKERRQGISAQKIK